MDIMMKLKYCFLLGCLLLMTACEEEVSAPDVQITTESTTYQVGEPVIFKFSGYADIIAFYSGEPTHDYAHKDGRVIDVSGEDVTLAFTSAVTGGEQEDQLTFLASTDFDGNYDNLASVK